MPPKPKPNEKLAESLSVLRELQHGGQRIFRSRDLSRIHRERLLRTGFVREVVKGWLMSSSPGAHDGDSTPWYASFWEFCARYCEERFKDGWHLSPEQSLLLHAQNTVIPAQVVVYSRKGTNHAMNLLFGTSLYDLKQAQMPPRADVSVQDGLKAVYASGRPREGSGTLLHAPSDRSAGRARNHPRRIGHAASFARWRPHGESRTSRRRVPADRPAGDRRRNRERDEGGRLRCA